MARDGVEQKIIDDIQAHGWSGMHIPTDDKGPGFSFSIGFWETLKTPEFIVFGLSSDLMHNMLWEVFHQIKAGKVAADGARWADLIEGFDCISRPVDRSHIREYFGTALWYRHYREGLSDFAFFQLFWPGKLDGLFPWEPDSSDTVRALQPALYLPNETGPV